MLLPLKFPFSHLPFFRLRNHSPSMPIDAHHFPVMFLFRGEFPKGKKLRGLCSSMLLTVMDNTYCNPSYAFPSREVAAQQVVDIIASHPQFNIILLQVWPERLQTMHLLGFDNVFTTNTSLTRIWTIARYSFFINTLEGLNCIQPTIGIMPSGLPWALKPVEQNSLFVSSHDGIKCLAKGINPRSCHTSNAGSFRKLDEYIYAAPYYDHSCYKEIKEFINLVCPANIRGIVSSSSCSIDPIYYFSCSEGVSQPSMMLK